MPYYHRPCLSCCVSRGMTFSVALSILVLYYQRLCLYKVRFYIMAHGR